MISQPLCRKKVSLSPVDLIEASIEADLERRNKEAILGLVRCALAATPSARANQPRGARELWEGPNPRQWFQPLIRDPDKSAPFALLMNEFEHNYVRSGN